MHHIIDWLSEATDILPKWTQTQIHKYQPNITQILVKVNTIMAVNPQEVSFIQVKWRLRLVLNEKTLFKILCSIFREYLTLSSSATKSFLKAVCKMFQALYRPPMSYKQAVIQLSGNTTNPTNTRIPWQLQIQMDQEWIYGVCYWAKTRDVDGNMAIWNL